ncbi:hypothetical protein [Thermosulfurimonas sp. F29]|nr:hypothetical protein [Thermosulfurimonas sp. F29]
MDPFTLNLLLMGVVFVIFALVMLKVSDWLEKREKTRAREV